MDDIDRLAGETGFSGVVRIDCGASTSVKAYGLAHRGFGVPNTPETRFAVASVTKGLAALAVVSLIEDGALTLDTTARSVLGADLPMIDPGVTVEHLLSHRSGIGDYADEETNPPLKVPVQELDTTESYLRALDGFPTKFAPGTRFSYSNAGYVVLALIAERTSGVPFPDLIRTRVCVPAGMSDTAFDRADALPERSAVGYLDREGPRTNVFLVPARGSGDGGCYTTVADLHALWAAFLGCRIVPESRVNEMTHPRATTQSLRYGLGFWLHPTGPAVVLDGGDHGVSIRTVHNPADQLTYTIVSNTSGGAWPLVRHLFPRLTP